MKKILVFFFNKKRLQAPLLVPHSVRASKYTQGVPGLKIVEPPYIVRL